MTTALRADAARNRDRLIDVARSVFAERGLDAPLDDIARQAGLGNATLYRHFPTRCALITAVFTGNLRDIVAAADGFLADPDPWNGFAGHLAYLCGRQADDRAVADLLTAELPGAPELDELRGRAYAGLVQLIGRAQRAGVLRLDFRHDDVVVILMANAGLLERTGAVAPEAWRRQLDYLLDGLRPGGRPATRGAGLPALRRAMRQIGARHGCAQA